MRKLLSMIVLFSVIGCSNKINRVVVKEKDTVYINCCSDTVDSMHTYPIHDSWGNIEYGTFEQYMWNEGFPDTIIVPFTRDGKFEYYIKAVRWSLLEDSLGNFYSPAYIYRTISGDAWVYDIKGNFVEFYCGDKPHSGTPNIYKP